MKQKPFVYISSPYTKGDSAINVKFQLLIFTQMMDEKIVYPYAPLVSHFVHTTHPRLYEDWIAYDLAILRRMDALITLDAEYPDLLYIEYAKDSKGVAIEKQVARASKIPIFSRIDMLYAWAMEE